jgi:phosphoesterase RecJ-like protein
MDTEYPDYLDFLNYRDFAFTSFDDYDKESTIDLLIVLDCHEEDRANTDAEIFQFTQKTLFIDHHTIKPDSLKEEHLYFIDSSAVSTGAILHRFLFKSVFDLSKKLQNDYAEYIYTTIVNDTDNFLNSNTDKDTYEICSELMDLGLKPNILTNKFLYSKPILYYRFIGETLASIELSECKKIAIYQTTLKMLNDNNLTLEANSKIMRWTKGAYDVEIQILIQEYDTNDYKVSLRSEKHDVAEIARHFGGGGHKRAAGFSVKGSFEEIKDGLLRVLTQIDADD